MTDSDFEVKYFSVSKPPDVVDALVQAQALPVQVVYRGELSELWLPSQILVRLASSQSSSFFFFIKDSEEKELKRTGMKVEI